MMQWRAEAPAARQGQRLAGESFPEWLGQEMDRLLRARAAASSLEERAQVDLQLAVLCDVAQRYGRRMLEASEL